MPSAEKEGYEAFQEINLVLAVSEESDTKNSKKKLDAELQAVRHGDEWVARY